MRCILENKLSICLRSSPSPAKGVHHHLVDLASQFGWTPGLKQSAGVPNWAFWSFSITSSTLLQHDGQPWWLLVRGSLQRCSGRRRPCGAAPPQCVPWCLSSGKTSQCGSLNKFKRYDVLVSNDMTKLWGNPAQKLAKRIIYKYIHKVVTRTKLLSVLKPSILSMFWITNVFYWPGNLLNNNY